MLEGVILRLIHEAAEQKKFREQQSIKYKRKYKEQAPSYLDRAAATLMWSFS
jgi:hypothetical protein